MKGVVGNTGRMLPRTPRLTNAIPKMRKSDRRSDVSFKFTSRKPDKLGPDALQIVFRYAAQDMAKKASP
jgi:hypothetical protein